MPPRKSVKTTSGVRKPYAGHSPTIKEKKLVSPASVASSTMPGATICHGQSDPCTRRTQTTQYSMTVTATPSATSAV
jgi:hypothetical protein